MQRFSSINNEAADDDDESDWAISKRFNNMTFYLDSDIGFEEELEKNIKRLLIHAGAIIFDVFDEEKVTCYVCDSRESIFYAKVFCFNLLC